MTTYSTLSTLYQEADRLDNQSLDAFIAQIMSMRLRREVSDGQKKEADLLKKINQSLSIPEINQFRFLNNKRVETGVSEQEQVELVRLLEKIEKLNVNRIKYLTHLARLRNISVRELMNQLGINTSING
jgi:hypothetical protein